MYRLVLLTAKKIIRSSQVFRLDAGLLKKVQQRYHTFRNRGRGSISITGRDVVSEEATALPAKRNELCRDFDTPGFFIPASQRFGDLRIIPQASSNSSSNLGDYSQGRTICQFVPSLYPSTSALQQPLITLGRNSRKILSVEMERK